MGYYKDLIAFKKSYELAMDIFMITKKFPKELLTFSMLVPSLPQNSAAPPGLQGP